MIKQIKLANIASYEKAEFLGLQRQNFIYGSNGSGKTTLSNYLADSTNLAYSDCSTTWENNTPLEILVYNKNFRQKHFNSTGKIPGIFTIGEKSQEIAEQIEAKNKEFESLKTNITTYKSTQGTRQYEIDDLYKKFKDNVWDKLYKKHELAFKEAFKGVMSNKDNFVNKVLSEYETHKNETALDYENLKKLSDKIYNSPNEKFSDLSDFPNINLEEVMQNPIYSKKIIGNKDVDIAPLINKLNNSDWVNAGRSFLGTNDKICPFCQQETISDKFIKELASFFDETYTKDLNTLKEVSDLYKVNSKNLLDFLDEIEKSQTSNNNTQLNLTLFSPHLKTLHSEVSQNLAKISSKEKEPSLVITLQSHKETIDAIKNILELARQKIKEHNDIIDTLAKQKEDLKNKIWCYLIKENETFIAQYNKNKQNCKKAISALTQKINKCKSEISALNEELKDLNKKDISTEAAVDNINDILRNYGFMNFQIVSAKDENTYTLKREDGSLIKDNLSEGEETFITFLYYMQLVHGSLNDDGIQKEKVLVIDDPISSLDSNILFIVSSLIKEELKKTWRCK